MLSCLRRGSKHLVRSKPVKASGAPRRTGRGRRARCDLGPKSGLMTRDRDSIGLRRHRWPREALRAAILARPHHPDQNAGQGSLMAPMMLAAAPPGRADGIKATLRDNLNARAQPVEPTRVQYAQDRSWSLACGGGACRVPPARSACARMKERGCAGGSPCPSAAQGAAELPERSPQA